MPHLSNYGKAALPAGSLRGPSPANVGAPAGFGTYAQSRSNYVHILRPARDKLISCVGTRRQQILFGLVFSVTARHVSFSTAWPVTCAKHDPRKNCAYCG